MLNIIVKAIFWVIGKVGDFVLLPVTSLISLLVPNLSVNLNNIFDFLQQGFDFVTFWLKALCVPSVCAVEILLVFTVYYGFKISIKAFHLIVRCYNLFKP